MYYVACIELIKDVIYATIYEYAHDVEQYKYAHMAMTDEAPKYCWMHKYYEASMILNALAMQFFPVLSLIWHH